MCTEGKDTWTECSCVIPFVTECKKSRRGRSCSMEDDSRGPTEGKCDSCEKKPKVYREHERKKPKAVMDKERAENFEARFGNDIREERAARARNEVATRRPRSNQHDYQDKSGESAPPFNWRHDLSGPEPGPKELGLDVSQEFFDNCDSNRRRARGERSDGREERYQSDLEDQSIAKWRAQSSRAIAGSPSGYAGQAYPDYPRTSNRTDARQLTPSLQNDYSRPSRAHVPPALFYEDDDEDEEYAYSSPHIRDTLPRLPTQSPFQYKII